MFRVGDKVVRTGESTNTFGKHGEVYTVSREYPDGILNGQCIDTESGLIGCDADKLELVDSVKDFEPTINKWYPSNGNTTFPDGYMVKFLVEGNTSESVLVKNKEDLKDSDTILMFMVADIITYMTEEEISKELGYTVKVKG